MSVQPVSEISRSLDPVDRPTRILQVLLVASVGESFIHYLDNWLRFDDYVAHHRTFPFSLVAAWMIAAAWLLYTFVALPLGYRAYRQGQWRRAAVWIGVYSTSGLISFAHFVDISVSDLSPFQNVFVFGDIALGVLLLAFAVWTAWTHREQPPMA
jgi:hypothetical protein